MVTRCGFSVLQTTKVLIRSRCIRYGFPSHYQTNSNPNTSSPPSLLCCCETFFPGPPFPTNTNQLALALFLCCLSVLLSTASFCFSFFGSSWSWCCRACVCSGLKRNRSEKLSRAQQSSEVLKFYLSSESSNFQTRSRFLFLQRIFVCKVRVLLYDRLLRDYFYTGVVGGGCVVSRHC